MITGDNDILERSSHCNKNNFDSVQICQSSLCDTLRLLGCFSTQTKLAEMDMISTMNYHNTLVSLFTGSVLEPVFPDGMQKTLGYACLLLRLLYDVALDSFDKPNLANVGIRSPSHKQNNVEVYTLDYVYDEKKL